MQGLEFNSKTLTTFFKNLLDQKREKTLSSIVIVVVATSPLPRPLSRLCFFCFFFSCPLGSDLRAGQLHPGSG